MSPEPDPGEPPCASFYTTRDLRNQRRFNLWLFTWAISYLAATAALRWREAIPVAVPWLAVGCAIILAIQATRRYLVFLREADELLRRIQTEALALGFGAGAALSLLYPLLEKLGAPAFDRGATALVMMISWVAGAWLGTRRYSGSSTSSSTGNGRPEN